MGIQVDCDYSKCEHYTEKLKHFEGKLSAVKEENYKNEAMNKAKVMVKLVGNEVDAENFYDNKIKDNKKKLEEETKKQESGNIGTAFVVFRSTQWSKQF